MKNKIMKKHIYLNAVLIALLLFAASCNDETGPDPLPPSDVCLFDETYDIKAIRSAQKPEKELVHGFLKESQVGGKTHFNPDDDFTEMAVVEYTNLEGSSIVLTYEDADKNSDELSLILVADEENELITYMEHNRMIQGDTEQVYIYLEGQMWLSALLDSETEDVLDFSFHGGKSDDDEQEESWTFAECLDITVSACLEDPSCAFICGIIWKYCLGSIALACYFSTSN